MAKKTNTTTSHISTGILETPVKQTGTLANLVPSPKVDMGAVVSYFISRYEKDLLDRKRTLTTQIDNHRKSTELTDKLYKELNCDQFTKPIPQLDNFIPSVSVSFQRSSKGVVTALISLTSSESNVRALSLQYTKTAEVSPKLAEAYTNYLAFGRELELALSETLNAIQNISRKEREVRGAIAERALREAGVTLLDDSTLLSLTTLPNLPTLSVG